MIILPRTFSTFKCWRSSYTGAPKKVLCQQKMCQFECTPSLFHLVSFANSTSLCTSCEKMQFNTNFIQKEFCNSVLFVLCMPSSFVILEFHFLSFSINVSHRKFHFHNPIRAGMCCRFYSPEEGPFKGRMFHNWVGTWYFTEIGAKQKDSQ